MICPAALRSGLRSLRGRGMITFRAPRSGPLETRCHETRLYFDSLAERATLDASGPWDGVMLGSGGELARAVAAVHRHVSRDHWRPQLTGIHLTAGDPSGFEVIVTDSFKLLRAPLCGARSAFAATVPAPVLRCATQGLTNAGALALDLDHQHGLIRVRRGDETWITATIPGCYPASDQIFSQAGEVTIFAERRALLHALAPAAALPDHQRGLSVEIRERDLRLQSAASSLYRSRVAVGVDYLSSPVAFTINAEYLLGAVAMLAGEIVSLRFGRDVGHLVLSDGTRRAAVALLNTKRSPS